MGLAGVCWSAVLGRDDWERNQAIETSTSLPTKRRTVIARRTNMMIIDITELVPPFENATGEYYRQVFSDVKQNDTHRSWT